MSIKNTNIELKTKFFLFLESLIPPFMLYWALDFFITVKYFLRILLFKRIKIDLPMKTSESAFLFATGPSLTNFNFSIINNSDCYSVSNFFLNDFAQSELLKGHFFAPFHSPLIESEYIEWLKKADSILHKDTKIYLSSDTKNLVNKNKIFLNRKVIYLELEKGLVLGGISPSRPILKPYTGPLMILPILIMMGYKNIYLCGCDHTVLRDYGKTVTNFYTEDKDIRSNATNKERWGSGIIHHLENMKKLILQYRRYKKIAEKNSIKIYNLSSDSWLEEFEFLDNKSLIEQKIK